ncbi:exported hypothetical protein [Pseudomonas jessenii]
MSCTTPVAPTAFTGCKRLLPALLLAIISGQSQAASDSTDPVRLGVM